MNNYWEKLGIWKPDMVESIPFVSVVMDNWNRKDILRHVLICRADHPSTDAMQTMALPMVQLKWLKQIRQVKLIRLNENCGIKGII